MFPLTYVEAAVALQKEISRLVVTEGDPSPSLVAGLDAAYARDGRTVFGAAALLAFPSLELVEGAWAACETAFPYIPGLFAFREGAALVAALDKLTHAPDLLIVDGHGVAHPRRCGIASHIGVVTGIPSIGVAKHLLCGTAAMPDEVRGSTAPMIENGETIGCAVRTAAGVRPVYVSVGHRTGLAAAVRLVLALSDGYRVPEPIRAAHALAARAWEENTSPEGAFISRNSLRGQYERRGRREGRYDAERDPEDLGDALCHLRPHP
ncbi:deoxyribonuclease V [Methanofollis tationis]|uniref:Endonuclease V n=1 Tax=Methanofollis tationis TaxID=81417 RepID=A0A7K4HRR3_9EURY|nr:deoxyribonuclease V [Methanofollis tationis]NVO67538.1 endonuclease V [Methanofollis tationis]